MKANKTMRGREASNHRRIVLIQLHTIKSLKNKKPKWQDIPHIYKY
jgi:hypothetical protein